MPYLVNVTFDLTRANPNKYRLVRTALKKIKLTTIVSGRKKLNLKLPANTFIAKVGITAFPTAESVASYMRSEIRQIFTANGVKGKYFVVVARIWAWKRGAVK